MPPLRSSMRPSVVQGCDLRSLTRHHPLWPTRALGKLSLPGLSCCKLRLLTEGRSRLHPYGLRAQPVEKGADPMLPLYERSHRGLLSALSMSMFSTVITSFTFITSFTTTSITTISCCTKFSTQGFASPITFPKEHEWQVNIKYSTILLYKYFVKNILYIL